MLIEVGWNLLEPALVVEDLVMEEGVGVNAISCAWAMAAGVYFSVLEGMLWSLAAG